MRSYQASPRFTYHLWRLGQDFAQHAPRKKPPASELPPHLKVALLRAVVALLIRTASYSPTATRGCIGYMGKGRDLLYTGSRPYRDRVA
jgi:hypothetical protein